MPRALARSLELLQRTTVDLYMHHYPSRWVSIPRLMNLMADAVEQGKVRAVGVSNYSADQMRLAHAVLADRGIPLASNQVEYSLLHRQPETDGVLDACRELGVTLIANQPLANGALTGKFVAGARPIRLPSLHAPLPGQGTRGGRRRSSPCSARSARHTIGARPRSRSAGSSRTQLVLPIPGAKNGRQAADNAGGPRLLAHPGRDRGPRSGNDRLARHERNDIVKLGLQIYSFTWPGGPEAIGPTLARAVRTADDVGFDSIWVMDHFWQIGPPGSELQPMLEGWTTLGFMAAHSQRARLGLMVGGVHYRNPGPVGQGRHDARRPVGRAGLARHRRRLEPGRIRGSRLPVPAAHRALRDARGHPPDRPRRCGRASAARRRTFHGRQFHATRLLNVPQSISRPRVPIMIGGGGEKKTLRLVAQYADASNLFGGPDAAPRRSTRSWPSTARRSVATSPRSSERTCRASASAAPEPGAGRPSRRTQIVERFGRLAEAGVQHVIVNFAEANDPAPHRAPRQQGSATAPRRRGGRPAPCGGDCRRQSLSR